MMPKKDSPFITLPAESLFSLELTPGPGCDILDAIKQAKVIAIRVGITVKFTFNGQRIIVNSNTDVQKIYQNFCSDIRDS